MVFQTFSEGWYCTGGATQPMPSDPMEGGRCQPGYYCPGGSDAPINCTGGYYCATPGLAAPTGECNQGEIVVKFYRDIHISPIFYQPRLWDR